MLATLEGIRAAAAHQGIARRTPVLDLSPLLLSDATDPAPSDRGANYLARLTDAQRALMLLGPRAVALAPVRRAGRHVMPETAPAVKVEARVGRRGGIAGTTTVHRRRGPSASGLLIVPPFDSCRSRGQGTAGLEVLARCRRPTGGARRG
jgi:hypothetical protein